METQSERNLMRWNEEKALRIADLEGRLSAARSDRDRHLLNAVELKRQLGEAGELLGKICVAGTIRPGESMIDPPKHAAMDAVLSVIRERDALIAWKSEQLTVEAEWDAQAVGRVLGVPLGASIRKAILPKIMALRSALTEAAMSLETIHEQSGHDEWMKHMDQVRGYANSRAIVARQALS